MDMRSVKPGQMKDVMGWLHINWFSKRAPLPVIEAGLEIHDGFGTQKELTFERSARCSLSMFHGGSTGPSQSRPKTIVAINMNSAAAVFKQAHIGMVGDWKVILAHIQRQAENTGIELPGGNNERDTGVGSQHTRYTLRRV